MARCSGPTTTALVATTNSSDWDAGPGFGLKLELTERGSKRLGGTFRLSLNGFDYTSDIAIGTSGDVVAHRMRMQLSLVRELTVTGRWSSHSYIYTFAFSSQGRNMPKIKVWTNDLTPRSAGATGSAPPFGVSDERWKISLLLCVKAAAKPNHYLTPRVFCGLRCPVGAKVTVDVNVLTDGGGNDLYYNPIPADFFERKTSKPQAVITVIFLSTCVVRWVSKDDSGREGGLEGEGQKKVHIVHKMCPCRHARALALMTFFPGDRR